MKRISSAISLLLVAIMLSCVFVSCSSTPDNTDNTESQETQEMQAPESPTESEGDSKEELPAPQMPTFTKSIITGDGSTVSFGAEISNQDYLAAVSYFLSEGFSKYSYDAIGNSNRAVFTKGDEYYTLVYNSKDYELTMVHSESGARALPEQSDGNSNFEKLCDTSVTQHYSKESSGMGYIFRLEDGSFIVYDGGYKSDAKDFMVAFTNLCLTNKIHIRAWIITHDHSDHYAAFSEIANKYSKRFDIDYIMYAPTTTEEANVINYYKEQLYTDAAEFKEAVLLPIHAGMTFNILNVKLEILQTPAMLSIHGKIADFNDTSIISRIVSSDGSAIMLADACGRSADWLVKNVGDGLKSDIVQVAHHGVETGSIPLYDAIQAPMVFWPCDQTLFASQRGEKIKQHIIEAEYSVEHVLHSYGTVTRKLSYRPIAPETMDIMPTDDSTLSTDNNGYATNARIEDGILKFDIADATDPFVVIDLENTDIGDKNVIRMVVDAEDAKDGWVFIQTAYDSGFLSAKSIQIGNQGTSLDGKTTYLIYFGNIAGIEDGIKSIRIDFGSEIGQTVEIYSIEAFNLDLSYTE